MRFSAFYLFIMLSFAGPVVGCQRAEERDAQQDPALAARAGSVGEEVSVTGCLTAAPDRNAFVVTADRNALTSGTLHASSGEVPTYTYELVDAKADLTPHVGRQVEVKGHLDPERDDEVDVESKDTTELPSARVGKDAVTPAIETSTEVEIMVRRLHVVSATPTGKACGQ